MKIGICDCHVVGDDHATSQDNPLGRHEHRAYQDTVITDLDRAGRLDVERGPSVDGHTVAQHEAGAFLTAKAVETVPPLEEAVAPDTDVCGKVFVRPFAGDFADVHALPHSRTVEQA